LGGRKKDSVVGDQIYNYVDMLRTFKHDYGKQKIAFGLVKQSFRGNHYEQSIERLKSC
jgi:hypothetical protein